MKKHRVSKAFSAPALLCVLLLITAAAFLSACNRAKPRPAAAMENSYDMVLNYNETDRTAELSQNVMITNRTGETLNEIKFHLYPNAFAKGAKHPPFLETDKKAAYYDGESYGGIEILSAEIDNKTVDYIIGGEDDTVLTLPCFFAPDATVDVDIECKITLPKCDARFGVTRQTVNLTGFYPSLCVWENGSWREEPYCAVGDPFYSEVASFYVTVYLPEDMTAAGSGACTAGEPENGVRRFDFTASNIRDFGMVASRGFQESTSTVVVGRDSVKTSYYSLNDKDPAGTLALINDVLGAFSKTFGEYPHKTYTVCEAPLNAGGMEYGAFSMISPLIQGDDHAETVVHETAHQWWYGAVGSDQINSPWLDEGLAQFSTAYYYKLSGDSDRYAFMISSMDETYGNFKRLPAAVGFNAKMNRPLSSYLTMGEYVAVIYMKGALLFESLYEIVGEVKFKKALSTYYSENLFAIAGQNRLCDAFGSAGLDVASIISGWVDDEVVGI